MAELTSQEKNELVGILKDHRQCLEEEDFEVCGKAMMARLRREGIEPTKEDMEEIQGKAALIWQIDKWIERLEE